jgi:hypothetical protein
MKRRVLAFLLLLTLLLASQVAIARAFQEVYDWFPCRIDVIASNYWQPTSLYSVKVRITLASEPRNYKMRADSVKVILSGENFVLESTNQERKELPTLNDYAEREFGFNISSEQLGGEENFTLSIVAVVNMSKVYSSTEIAEVWDSFGSPMIVSPGSPPPMASESVLLIGVITGVILVTTGIIGFVVLKKKKRKKKK